MFRKKSNIIKIIFILIALIVSFFYGAGVAVYKWFPFKEILMVKQIVIAKKTVFDVSINHQKNQTFTSYLDHRNLLKESVIVGNELINITQKPRDEMSDLLKIKIYGLTVSGVLTKAINSKKCLRIYIQGHGGDPFKFEYHNELLDSFIEEGCDTLSLSMVGLGLNRGNIFFPTHSGNMKLNEELAADHRFYSFFYDSSRPQLDPLSLFLSPHYYLINHLINEYEDTTILGISGGGWYTVWLAALMPEINRSISYAGSLPNEYRKYIENLGDWEDTQSHVYGITNYWWLYRLMTIDEEGNPNRNAILVYNSLDECCYRDPSATHFQKQIESLNWQNLSVIIDKEKDHVMNANLVKKIFQNK
jgi:hypothetical protein